MFKKEQSDRSFQMHSPCSRRRARKWGPKMSETFIQPLETLLRYFPVSDPYLGSLVLRFLSFSLKFSWTLEHWPKSQFAWHGTW